MQKRFHAIFFSCLFSCAAIGQVKNLHVLFVGNSLTYSNDLPSMLAEIAAADSIKLIHKSFTFPDYSLEDHWNEGRVEAEIESGNYDYVILQQGPSALDESRVLLIEYVKRFAGICKNAKAKPVLFMVWPSKARLFDLDRVIKNHRDAAIQTGSILCPAGLAWKYGWIEDPALSLYSTDGFHPSVTGSLLAALTIYAGLRGLKDLATTDVAKLPAAKKIQGSVIDILKRALTKSMESP